MITIGFIGTGNISGAHLKYLKTRKDVRIAGLCDIRPDQAQRRQQEYGGATFTDYQVMLKTLKLDAVYLCTPPTVRHGPLTACARLGLPVFCEKPVARREAEGITTARALARLKGRVQVGYVFRCLPIIAELKQALQDDTPHLIQSFYACGVSLSMTLPAWFYLKDRSGGALVDQATHNVDLLRYLFGEVTEIRGLARNPVRMKNRRYTVDETIGVVFAFRSGLLGSHVHTWVGDSWRNEMVISGEKRLYRLCLNRKELQMDSAGGAASKPAVGSQNPAESRSMYVYENERFLHMVKTGNWKDNPCTYADGLKSLQLTLACDKAVTRGHALLAATSRKR